jgi:hypothetical protein
VSDNFSEIGCEVVELLTVLVVLCYVFFIRYLDRILFLFSQDQLYPSVFSKIG